MLYKLLGMAVWKAGKMYLRRRNGRTYMPKSVLAGVAVLVVGAAVAAVFGGRKLQSGS
jgi:hypothetical protein